MSLLALVPKERRPRALLVAALDLLCETSVALQDTPEMEADEARDMLCQMLIDAAAEGIIKGHRRILNRFELVKLID